MACRGRLRLRRCGLRTACSCCCTRRRSGRRYACARRPRRPRIRAPLAWGPRCAQQFGGCACARCAAALRVPAPALTARHPRRQDELVSAALGGEAGRQAAEATLAEATVRAEAAAMLRRRLLFAHASHVVDSLAVRGPASEPRGRARRPRLQCGTRPAASLLREAAVGRGRTLRAADAPRAAPPRRWWPRRSSARSWWLTSGATRARRPQTGPPCDSSSCRSGSGASLPRLAGLPGASLTRHRAQLGGRCGRHVHGPPPRRGA